MTPTQELFSLSSEYWFYHHSHRAFQLVTGLHGLWKTWKFRELFSCLGQPVSVLFSVSHPSFSQFHSLYFLSKMKNLSETGSGIKTAGVHFFWLKKIKGQRIFHPPRSLRENWYISVGVENTGPSSRGGPVGIVKTVLYSLCIQLSRQDSLCRRP